MSYIINPTVIFSVENGAIIATIPLTQRRFKLTDQNFIKRIYSISQDPNIINISNSIDVDLIKAEILIPKYQQVNWDGDQLSLIFHQSTRNVSQEYNQVSPEEDIIKSLIRLGNSIEELPERYVPKTTIKTINLPSPNVEILKNFSLDECIRRRKTCRDFFDIPTKLEDLSTILFYNFGYIHGTQWKEFDEAGLVNFGERKSSPSASGLQCCDAFVLIMNVEEIESGIYFYKSETHSLDKISEPISKEKLSFLLLDQYWAKNISFGIFITIDLRRVWIKDKKPRGYISSYIEIGHISQTLQLSCIPLNLSSWITGSFRDEILKDVLSIKDEFIFSGFFFGAGSGSGSAIPPLLKNNIT